MGADLSFDVVDVILRCPLVRMLKMNLWVSYEAWPMIQAASRASHLESLDLSNPLVQTVFRYFDLPTLRGLRLRAYSLRVNKKPRGSGSYSRLLWSKEEERDLMDALRNRADRIVRLELEDTYCSPKLTYCLVKWSARLTTLSLKIRDTHCLWYYDLESVQRLLDAHADSLQHVHMESIFLVDSFQVPLPLFTSGTWKPSSSQPTIS